MDALGFIGSCVVASSSVDVKAVDGAWVEVLHAEIGTDGVCPSVDLELPPGVTLDALRARVRLSDGSRRPLDGPRRERIVRDLAGAGAVRLHAPDLIPGDHVVIEATRRWPTSAWDWSAAGGFSPRQPVAAPTRPDPPARVSQRVELEIPGDFRRSLYPGGGSSAVTHTEVSWPEGDASRAIVLPIPPAATDVQITGPHERRDDSVLLRATDGSTEQTVRWRTPDAPTHGVRPALPGADLSLVVTAPEGRVRWDGDVWWLASLGLSEVLPDRPLLIRALENRFGRASMPEPALPAALRGHPPDLELAASLRPILLDRAGVLPPPVGFPASPVDPLFPRKLLKARRSGALTSTEAALTLAVQLAQARIPAGWALARPAPDGPGPLVSPAGYTRALTVLSLGEQTWWIDPSCRVCAPFELPPDLEGADVLSPNVRRTPEPREGRLTVRDTPEERAVALEGPPALLLRLALLDVASDDRGRWLAERFGGPGADLLRSEGLGQAGAPIALAVRVGEAPPDPLAPPAGPWWGWLGERVWERPGDDPDRHEHAGPLCWTVRAEAGRATERLIVTDRRVDPPHTARVQEARARDISRDE